MGLMDTVKKYNITSIIVGTVLFIYILYLINASFGISDMKSNTQFPPWVSPCPDYWSNVGGNKCVRTMSNGNISCPAPAGPSSLRYDFSSGTNNPVDMTGVSMRDKCNWANSCKIYWEGVTDKPCSAYT